jgi:hypothetical protein
MEDGLAVNALMTGWLTVEGVVTVAGAEGADVAPVGALAMTVYV